MPVGTMKGTGWLPWSALTCRENPSVVPHATLESSVAWNGVAFVPASPKVMSGYDERGWLTVTPGGEGVSRPETAGSEGSAVFTVASRSSVGPRPSSAARHALAPGPVSVGVGDEAARALGPRASDGPRSAAERGADPAGAPARRALERGGIGRVGRHEAGAGSDSGRRVGSAILTE